jgi:putative sterol carrier protein
MTKFLTDEWFAQAHAFADVLPEQPGKGLILQHVMKACPEGVPDSFHQVYENGRLVTFAPGRHPEPEVTLTESYETALKVNLGTLNPRTAMLTGKIRPGGDVLKLMAMMPLIQSEEYQAMQQSIAAITEP